MKTYEVNPDNEHEILAVEDQVFAVVRTHHSCAKRILLTGPAVATAGVAASFVAQWKGWEGDNLTAEVTPIKITFTGPTTYDSTLTPTLGAVEFDVVFSGPGVYKLYPSASFPCDAEPLEVVVSG